MKKIMSMLVLFGLFVSYPASASFMNFSGSSHKDSAKDTAKEAVKETPPPVEAAKEVTMAAVTEAPPAEVVQETPAEVVKETPAEVVQEEPVKVIEEEKAAPEKKPVWQAFQDVVKKPAKASQVDEPAKAAQPPAQPAGEPEAAIKLKAIQNQEQWVQKLQQQLAGETSQLNEMRGSFAQAFNLDIKKLEKDEYTFDAKSGKVVEKKSV